jgi:Transcription factor involved in chromatin remodeling, contains bromodomain
LCNSGCLSLEPSLLICSGTTCTSTRIRRNTVYYSTRDGSKTWCQKCYPSLPSILPNDDGELPAHENLYKRDLLKRKNDEDVVERWVDCKKCKRSVHQMCAFADEFSGDLDNFLCPLCTSSPLPRYGNDKKFTSGVDKSVYSFLTGSEFPERIEDITHGTCFDARSLPRSNISDFIQNKVQERMRALNCPTGAEETLTVRIISDCQKEFNVPDVVLHHFRMQQIVEDRGVKTYSKPPDTVDYRSKAIALFQRIDGMDVCIFCVYVQEYEGAGADDHDNFNQKKRVYLAYLDSVDHFRPRCMRSNIYHEFLAAYFATARARGFVNVHIWSCPPSRGNSFVFWAHPNSQRTPTKEHLLTWYHNVLSHAVNCGIITDVMSLYESNFEQFDKSINKDSSAHYHDSTMVCPPLLDGDFWIEEANRVQSASMMRWSRSKRLHGDKLACDEEGNFLPERAFDICTSRCPVIQFAILLESCIMKHPSAAPFLRPVNAAALHLNDYHDVIEKPMDLGTILSKSLMGEYEEFNEIVSDLELTCSNAMRYNPSGHPVHTMANDILGFIRKQLRIITEYWRDCGVRVEQSDADMDKYTRSFQHLGMRLSTSIANSALSSTNSEDGNRCKNKTDGTMKNKPRPIFGGPDGIAKLMVGDDLWLLDKRHTYKDAIKKKTKSSKKKEVSFDSAISDGVRRETWLSDEVLTAVRSQRAVNFVCTLCPKPQMNDIEIEKQKMFTKYIEGFDLESCASVPKLKCGKQSTTPTVTETRHGLVSYLPHLSLNYLHNFTSKLKFVSFF